MKGIPHRYLTERIPGVGGTIKQEFEDFQVFEVPLYEPSGEGEHTYFEVEKRDLATLDAIHLLARALDVPRVSIGHAGLKDRRSISRQVFSVRLIPPEKIRAVRISGLEVLWTKLHGNKLRVGHLKGNRFRIRVRGIRRDAEKTVGSIIALLEERGVPNYYGPQRFGSRGDAHRLGKDLLLLRHREVVERLLGFPSSSERNPEVHRARRLFEAGDLEGALERFPSSYRLEIRLLRYLLRAPGNYRGAVRKIDENLRKIYISAFQSALFNELLDRRLELSGGRPGRLFDGDLAQLHRNRAVFPVSVAAEEQHRAEAGELSPSGPLFGKMMTWPSGLQGELEEGILREHGLRPTIFHQMMQRLRMKGSRRALRFPVSDLCWQVDGRVLELEFFLPRGSYATTFLREILKNDDTPFCYHSDAREPLDEAFYRDLEIEHEAWRASRRESESA